MTNEELIKALREAKKHFWTQPQIELYPMMEAAADALEAADKRIVELEAQIPKRGEWIQMNGHRYCNVCGHKDSPILTNYCPNCGAKMRGERNEQ